MSILSKPYPKDTTIKRKLIFALLFGLFVFLFLFFFQPFGINEWVIQYKVLLLAGYGLITTIALLFHFLLVERMFPKWFAEENWKVWKEIIWVLWIIFFIGTCNLLYSKWQAGFSFTFMNFISYQWITLLIGLFPVIVGTLINYARLQAKNLKAAIELNKVIEADVRPMEIIDGKSLIELTGEGARESIHLTLENILYIEAADNYVEVVWLENNMIQKKLLRNTLKNLEHTFSKMPQIFRCHRSFIINLTHVIKVSGNSQGYKLHFANLEKEIPVSRQFNEIIREKISNMHSFGPN
jgi:hypothetical protein